MRKFSKTMALLLALALVFTTFGAVTVSAASFSDTQGHWAEGVIDKWSSAGVVNGYSDGTFKPDNNITRAELAKVISTARQYTASADINFSDVAAGDWYTEDLKKCVAAGVIGGYEDGTFKPDNNVTREEAAAMFQRAYQVNSHGLITFADSAEISPWAETAVTALVGTGVINGYPEDNTFRPAASITRAEVVKVLDGITNVGTQPGSTANPGQNEVSAGTVVNGGLGGSANGGGYAPSGGGGSPGGSGNNGVSVTFNANGGKFANGRETTSITVSKNSVIGGAEPTATRTEEGPVPTAGAEPEVITYTFNGWYKSKQAADNLDDTQKWDINTDRVTAGMTLYAGWYKNGEAVVSFSLNGGYVTVVDSLGVEDTVTEISTQIVKTDGHAEKPAEVPARDHYTFMGWYADPAASSAFDFAGTPIKTNTTIYAGWKVDADYAALEVTMPDVTIGSTLNGTVVATPAKAVPGETVSLKVISPDGYKVRAVKSLSYISSVTGERTEITNTTMVNGVVTFTLPGGIQDGTMQLEVYFTAGVESEEPPATPAPIFDDLDQGPGYQSYKFSYPEYAEYTGKKLPAKTDFNGFSISSDCDLSESNKSFIDSKKSDGSTRSYAYTLKIGKNTATFSVYGPCEITIDAVSASSSENRSYTVKDGSGKVLVDNFMCNGNATPTCIFEYTGGPGTISIKSEQGVNLYGIIMYYGEDFVMPTATPVPTPDPNLKHKINIGDVTNGSATTDAEQVFDKDGKFTNYQESFGKKVTVSVQPNDGCEVLGVYTSPNLAVTKESDTEYSFEMPYEDVKVSARCIQQNAEMHTISAVQPENGTVTITPGSTVMTEPVVNSTETFMTYNGGGWATSYDGIVPSEIGLTPSAVENSDEIRGNATNKIMVSDKEVLYALDEAINGPFTLSYDIYTKGGNGQSFRTYLDNAADPVDAATGKATAGGNSNAFFHMTNLKDRIYVTSDVADLSLSDPKASKTATMLSKNEFEDGRWFKVYIKGNTHDDTVTVEYYRHGTNGTYSASSTVANAEISSDAAPFVTGRNKSIKQIRLAKATSGNVYYDNIKLMTYNDDEYLAYEGEEFTVNAKPSLGYVLNRVTVTDAAGNVTEAEPVMNSSGAYIAKVPSSDATISAEFVTEPPADPPAELKAITGDLEFAVDDYISGELGDPTYLMDNNVFLSGAHSYSSEKGSSVVGSLGSKKNCLRLTGATAYVAVMPAYDAEITVYSEGAAGRTIGAGTRPGSCGLYIGGPKQEVNTFTVKAGTCVFITGVDTNGVGNDVYLAGITVKRAGSAAEAAEQPEEEPAVDAAAPEEAAAEAVEKEEEIAEAVDETASEDTVSEDADAQSSDETEEADAPDTVEED